MFSQKKINDNVYTSFEKLAGDIFFKELIRRCVCDFRKEEMQPS